MEAWIPASADADDAPERGSEPSVADVLARAGLFEALGTREKAVLSEAAARHRVRRHEIVIHQGESLDALYIVGAGSFKLVRQSRDGKELIVSLAGAGECFGALGVALRASALVQALETARFVTVPVSALQRAMEDSSRFALELLALAEARRASAEAAAARMVFESVPLRLSAFLLEATHAAGELRYPLNQSEIASLVGSSRETVCSVLGQFRKAGMIRLDRGAVRVLDRARLASIGRP